MARGLPTGGQGSKVYVLCAEPKEHKHFSSGYPAGRIGYLAGRIGDRGDREIVYVPNVYVPFPAPSSGKKISLPLKTTKMMKPADARHAKTHRVLKGAAQRGGAILLPFVVLQTLSSCSKMRPSPTLKHPERIRERKELGP